jgi:hypothetical protein
LVKWFSDTSIAFIWDQSEKSWLAQGFYFQINFYVEYINGLFTKLCNSHLTLAPCRRSYLVEHFCLQFSFATSKYLWRLSSQLTKFTTLDMFTCSVKIACSYDLWQSANVRLELRGFVSKSSICRPTFVSHWRSFCKNAFIYFYLVCRPTNVSNIERFFNLKGEMLYSARESTTVHHAPSSKNIRCAN